MTRQTTLRSRAVRQISDPDPLLDQNEAAAMLGLTPRALESMRFHRRGPAFVRVGSRVRYRRSSLEKYLDSHTIGTRDQEAPSSAIA